jgi:hypothetical protein
MKHDPDGAIGRNEINPELEGKSNKELREEIHDLMSSPDIQRIQEAWTARMYVTFTQLLEQAPLDAQGSADPVIITVGPYLDVEISSRKMYATGTEDGFPSHLLATMVKDHWQVHDGLEEDTPFCAFARIHTSSPEPEYGEEAHR